MAVDSLAASERPAGVAVDLRPLGLSALGNRRGRRGHRLRRMVRVLGYAAVMIRAALSQVPSAGRLAVPRRPDAAALDLRRATGGLQWLVECGSFTLFITIVGGLGTLPQAATMLALDANSVAWVPMMGMGMAVSTLVGQQLGGNRPDMAAGRLDRLPAGHVLHVQHVAVLLVGARLVPYGARRGHGPGEVRPAAGPDRDPAALRGGLLPLRRHERRLHQRDPRRGRHPLRPLHVAGHVAGAVGPGLAGHLSLAPGPLLVLDADHPLGLLGRLYLSRPFPARPLAFDAG